MMKALADEELAHVGLVEVDQRGDLSNGAQLAPAVDEALEERSRDAAAAIGGMDADEVDPARRPGDAELRLGDPAEQEAHHAAIALGDQGHPWRPQRGDVEPRAPVVLARLSRELLVDGDDGVEVARLQCPYSRGLHRRLRSGRRRRSELPEPL